MLNKKSFFKKHLFIFFLLILLFTSSAINSYAQSSKAIIIDQTCTDISQIPPYWIEQAKLLTLHYAHTSHGSQVTSGIENLESQHPIYSIAIRESTTEGLPPLETPSALRIYDGNPPETYISPEAYWQGDSALNRTRAVANTGNYKYSMWSWCGEVSWSTEAYIDQYLNAMNILKNEYPNMRFIYMTGHLDGSGSSGKLHTNNERIRAYCIANNKVDLFRKDIGLLQGTLAVSAFVDQLLIGKLE